ncbi:MAG: DUF3868 domain-containing protein [Tannerellaceae bacterium]
MKKIGCLLLIACSVLGTQAQTVYKGQVRVEHPSVVRSSDNRLTISMDVILLNNLEISSNRSAVLTPILESGAARRVLPPIVVYGHNRDLVSQRNSQVLRYAYTMLRRRQKTEQKIHYLVQLPYEHWMQTVKLSMDANLCGCRNKVKVHSLEPIMSTLLRQSALQPAIAYLLPPVEAANAPAFNATEIQAIIHTCPQQLSLEEIFSLAQTFEPGSESFNHAFQVAVLMFPEDTTANLNAAAMEIQRGGDLSLAKSYLAKTSLKTGATLNNRGVIAWLEGDLNTAKLFFLSAEKAGCAQATTNLKNIEK